MKEVKGEHSRLMRQGQKIGREVYSIFKCIAVSYYGFNLHFPNA